MKNNLIGKSLFIFLAFFALIFTFVFSALGISLGDSVLTASAATNNVSDLHRRTKIYSSRFSSDYYVGCEDYADYYNESPAITVLTHGLNGNASHWSNQGGSEFAYDSTSLISKIGKKLHNDYDLYVAKGKNGNLELHKVNLTDYSNYTDDLRSVPSTHIHIRFWKRSKGLYRKSTMAIYRYELRKILTMLHCRLPR